MQELRIELDDDVFETMTERAKERGEESTEEYIETTLRKVAIHISDRDDVEAKVEQKLEDLGYL